MNVKRSFSIKGVGKFLPATQVNSEDIEKQLKLPANWINKFIGVDSRYIVKDESNTMMGAAALQEALDDANMKIGDIDCLIAASATFDYVLPNRSAMLKNYFKDAHELDFPCLDINTACTSFITALDYASMLLASGDYKNIAIVSSEISSKGVSPENTETYCLFGDCAAAVVLSTTDETAGLINYDLKNYPEGAKYTIIEGGGNMNHSRDTPYDAQLFSFKMEGKKLLKLVMKNLPEFFENFFKKTSTSLAGIDWIVPHQTSKMGMKLLKSMNGEKSSNIIDILAKYGNCIAASIPLALVSSIQDGKIKEGQTCMLLGTSAGLSISGLLIKYSSK